ncbi:leucine-rich repeat domain-containing protein [Pricia sp.]|uniref:leucine-rich repeat domain-containing protein n=1 Tax=Pricia sp. TaxID=2268138 RepID=UPI003593742B
MSFQKPIFRLIILFSVWFFGIQTILGQSYTDEEIGFNAQKISQKLLNRGIPQEEISRFIAKERELYLDTYVQMLSFKENHQSPLSTASQSRTSSFGTAQQYESTASATSTDCSVPISSSEKQALIDLYNATGGPSWSNSWDIDNTEPCQWHGVTVINGNVSELELYNNGLSGSIPASIGDLFYLNKLSLASNQLSGNIPPELGTLINLNRIDLASNQLSGSIPSELGNLTNLTHVYLNNNQLDGALPPELEMLTNLENLYLNTNQINGNIPSELGNLISLKILSLGSNQLDGSIPPEMGNLTNLTYLYLNNNQIGGGIPLELGNLINLKYLYLNFNQLVGNIPLELGSLANLDYLNLSINQLTGSIPPELGNLSNLLYFHLNVNQLSGSIPSELGNLIKLNRIDLRYNQLTGSIPPELGNLLNINRLYLDNNQLSGIFPPELGNLSTLTHLYLNQNQFTGSIPIEIQYLTNLSVLQLNNNAFNGSIPIEMGYLTKLGNLNLSFNQLSGTIPVEIGNLHDLGILGLANNRLSGNIPSELANMTDLYSLYIDGNQYQFGDLEDEFNNLDSKLIYFNYSPQDNVNEEETFEINEFEDITLTVSTSGSQNHYNWFKNGVSLNAPDSPDLIIENAQFDDSGTYHCEVSNDIVTGLILRRENINISVRPLLYEDRNTITSRSYDINGIEKVASKTYYDELGKQVQTQRWDREYNSIWASEIRYDYLGRPALSTLEAPLLNSTFFQYQEGFIKNGDNSTDMTISDLEQNPSNPPNIGNAPNTLGWYYSDSNTRESFQDITEHPFSRSVYSSLIPGKKLFSVGGNRIDSNGDDQIFPFSDSFSKTYSFTVQASQELSRTVAFADTKYDSHNVLKTVTRDVHGNENVVFTDMDGKVLASARSGGPESRIMTIQVGEQGLIDIHVPQGENMGFTVNVPSGVTYRVFNLITEGLTNDSPLSPNGFYRVAINSPEDYTGGATVTYKENYYDYTLNEYDDAGRIAKVYQPLGTSTSTKPKTNYEYNTLGQLTKTINPDEGTSSFKYRQDGQIRYSQNSEQATRNEVSFTDYDGKGRPVQSGIVSSDFQTLNPDDENFTVPYSEMSTATDRDNHTITVYDARGYNVSWFDGKPDYKATFTAGRVAETSNKYGRTFYSYDIYGRVNWLVLEIPGLKNPDSSSPENYVTQHYEYHPISGLVQQVIYGKDSSDQFIHRYTYNDLHQLTTVETSKNGQDYTLQANYEYYETGMLKRTELAPDTQGIPLQGIDYVYNINGQLKSINHPSLEASYDPDGVADVFGMQIDYHNTDYSREVSGIETPMYGDNQYNGNIKGIRWNSNAPNTTSQAYSYKYERNNWLTSANYGKHTQETDTGLDPAYTDTNTYVSGTSTLKEYSQSITLAPGFHAEEGSDYIARIVSNGGFDSIANGDYDVTNITYDANGNILSLKRNKDGGMGNNGMDDLSYNYNSSTNQLNHVSDMVDASASGDDIDSQNSDNYIYDAIGQLVRNDIENVDYLYNTNGLVTEVKKNGSTLVKFHYNERNHRYKKEVFTNGSQMNTETYVRDLSGSILAIYRNGSLVEQPIYGLGRLGLHKPLDESDLYEITDHLGNVRAVVGRSDSGTPIGLVAATDYYPFGSPMPGRNIVGDYRYGYQGQYSEKDDETGLNAFELRMYDSRIGRWTSPDPYGQFDSPYIGMGNNPISYSDPDGGCVGKDCPDSITTGENDCRCSTYDIETGIGTTHLMDISDVFGFASTSTANWKNPYTSLQLLTNFSSRPDQDGIVTEAEADRWRKIGNGQSLLVDFSKLDFQSSRLSVQDFKNGNNQLVNFFKGVNIHAFKSHVIYRPASDNTLSWVHGTLNVVLLDPNNGTVTIDQSNGYFDIYDFHKLNIFAPSGDDFLFYGYGKGKINVNTPPFPKATPNFRPFGL